MKILFKYPTRGRPLKFFRCLNRYYEYLSDTENFEFLISCDLDDPEMNNPLIINELSKYKNLTVKFGENKTKIQAVNSDMGGKDFDILFLVSDDMIPEVKGFDAIIRDKMQNFYPDTDGVLWFFDGWRRDLNTLSIFGKKFYDRFGYIYHPAYNSFWPDMEFTEVANMLGKQTFIDEVIVRHLHPDIIMADAKTREKFWEFMPEFHSAGSFGHDALWQKNSIPDDPDYNVYLERKAKGFDLLA